MTTEAYERMREHLTALIDANTPELFSHFRLAQAGEFVLVAYVADASDQDNDSILIMTGANQPLHRTIGLLSWANDIQFLAGDNKEDP